MAEDDSDLESPEFMEIGGLRFVRLTPDMIGNDSLTSFLSAIEQAMGMPRGALGGISPDQVKDPISDKKAPDNACMYFLYFHACDCGAPPFVLEQVFVTHRKVLGFSTDADKLIGEVRRLGVTFSLENVSPGPHPKNRIIRAWVNEAAREMGPKLFYQLLNQSHVEDQPE